MRKWLNVQIQRRIPVLFIISLPLSVCVAAIPAHSSASTRLLCNTVAQYSWAQNCTEQQGDGSPMVQALQAAMEGWNANNGFPCASINIDGNFGSATAGAVECLQDDKGLTDDSKVGPQTWGFLYGLLKHQYTDGNWSYWDTFHHPMYPWFRQWVPSGIWYVEGAAGSGTYTQMDWG